MNDDYLGGHCECGSSWFQLAPAKSDDGHLLVPAFCISREGEISGWAGVFACVECGKRWEPDQQDVEPAPVIPLSSAKLRRHLALAPTK